MAWYSFRYSQVWCDFGCAALFSLLYCQWLELFGCYIWIHVIYFFCLLWNCFLFLFNFFIFSLNHRDLQPNIGLFWYFFTEMFEHFRPLFLFSFQMNAIVLYLVPLTIKLHKQPIFLATILIALTSIFRSYPCVGDIAFYMALFPLWKHSTICKFTYDNHNRICAVWNLLISILFWFFSCSDGQLFRCILLFPHHFGAGSDCLVSVDLLQFSKCQFLFWCNIGFC